MDFLYYNKLINENLISLLCNKKETEKLMGVATPYPILLQINEGKDLKQQVNISGQSRYYTDKIYNIAGKKYVVSSQWYGPETTKKDTKTPFIRLIKNYLIKNNKDYL